MTPLPPGEVAAFAAASAIWRGDTQALVAELRFPGFRDAIAFVLRVAFEAEAADHHPEIRNTYDRVTLRLATHDAGNRVTARDLALARAIEALPGAVSAARPAPPRTPPPAPAG